MSYLQDFRSRNGIGGKTLSDKEKTWTEYEIEKDFEDDPSYRKAILKKHDLSEIEIGIRMVNTNKPSDKKFYLIPNKIAEVGDYVVFNEEDMEMNYLIMSFEYNLISDCCNVFECNQMLKLPSGISFPCVVRNDSYGSKTSNNNDILGEIDTKAKVIVQTNVHTLNECDLNTRYMFEHSKFDIYKCTDINTSISKGLMTMITKKDDYLPRLDRPEDNYCWQGEYTETPKPTEYVIVGEESPKVGVVNQYMLIPNHPATFIIEGDEGQIISHNGFLVDVKNLGYKEGFDIVAIVNGEKVATKSILGSRW